ncbi:type II toxin-antitoxin system RelE/ParE family toxin [Devosia sp. RR2S18]|nr:type II toxin-antitoxin system RelE/ParE family toxin [Devosia sp. RR2S18]WIJ26611.1 type II toxin-antitoxin system RelE/ParE family toxin [Devosia sp. RR2S18]
MHCVTETQSFRRAAEQAGMTEDEVMRLKNLLSENPDAGDLIVGTGGARKVRYAKAGKGKSGGYRVITYYTADDIPVFLMDVYAKGEKINLTPKERVELKKELDSFAEEYRAMVREKVSEMRRSEKAS